MNWDRLIDCGIELLWLVAIGVLVIYLLGVPL